MAWSRTWFPGSTSVQLLAKRKRTCLACSSSLRVRTALRLKRANAEKHSIGVPHHATRAGSSSMRALTRDVRGSLTQSGTTAEASQNLIVPLPVLPEGTLERLRRDPSVEALPRSPLGAYRCRCEQALPWQAPISGERGS